MRQPLYASCSSLVLTSEHSVSGFQNRAAVDGRVLSEQETTLVLCHGHLRPLLDLPFAGFAAHLPDELGNLQQPRGADRMAARAKAAAWIDRHAAAQRGD